MESIFIWVELQNLDGLFNHLGLCHHKYYWTRLLSE